MAGAARKRAAREGRSVEEAAAKVADSRVKAGREAEWEPKAPLPNRLHEVFANECLRVRSAPRAYENAAWLVNKSAPNKETCRSEGYKLAYDEDIVRRVAYLRQELQESMNVTAKTAAVEFNQAIEMAADEGNADAMTRAIQAKVKLFGLDATPAGVGDNLPPARVEITINDRTKKSDKE